MTVSNRDGGSSGRRILSVVAVALLLVTAGCGGSTGGTPTPTAGPTNTATDTETTGPTTTVAGDRPPGVAADGSVNVTRLVAAHDSALTGEAFTVEVNLTRTLTRNGTTQQIVGVQRSKSNGEGEFLTSFRQQAEFDIRQTTWGNESVAVARANASGQIRYQRADPDRIRDNLTAGVFAEQFLSAGQFTLDSTESDGERFVLTATATSEDLSERLGRQVTTVENYQGRVVVDRRGRIREFQVTFDVTLTSGAEGEIEVRMDLSGVGSTTVERPEWVSEGLEQTAGSSG